MDKIRCTWATIYKVSGRVEGGFKLLLRVMNVSQLVIHYTIS